MMRYILLFLFCVTFLLLSNCSDQPDINYDDRAGIIVLNTSKAKGSLLLIDVELGDSLIYTIVDEKDTLSRLACDTKYTCYFKREVDSDYVLVNTFHYKPLSCKSKLTYQQLASDLPKLNYLVQDFTNGSIYQLGKRGRLMEELDSAAGFIRGFDRQDSLLAWCSDSSRVTIKNLKTQVRREIEFDSLTKLHHDLVLHYPFLTVLYNRKNYKTFNSHQVIEEGFIKVNLNTGVREFWSIHEFLSDKTLPIDNAKGKFVTAHGNSVDVDHEGSFYISFRDFSQIWKVSSDLKAVYYQIGKNTDLFELSGAHFIGQHSIDITKPDQFYLFDNGSTGKGKFNSRIVRVSVDSIDKKYDVENLLSLPDSLSTIRMGSVNSFNDRLVISVFNNGLNILEIDLNGAVRNHLRHPEAHAIKVLAQPQNKLELNGEL
jgi:Arylsulfotransferase (ASST)